MPHEKDTVMRVSTGCSLAGRGERFTQFAAEEPGKRAADGQTGQTKNETDIEPVGQISAGLDTNHHPEHPAQAKADHGNGGEQKAKDT